MTRSRTTLLAITAVLAGASLSGLGVAQADNSTTPTAATSTIVVNGTDTITIDPSSSDATQQATYQTALGDALTNAGQKATFIATQVGATLGAVTNVTENSDSSGELCGGPILYAAGTATPTTSTGGKAKHKKARRLDPAVIVDPVSQCSIEADVTVTYGMTPA
jgi:uncharacterized protein YggE